MGAPFRARRWGPGRPVEQFREELPQRWRKRPLLQFFGNPRSSPTRSSHDECFAID